MRTRMLLSAVAVTALLGVGWQTRAQAGDNGPQQLVNGLAGNDAVACFASLRQGQEADFQEAILRGTTHRSPRVRGQCARLLGLRQDVTLAENLKPLLIDPNPGVRQQAARALVPLLDSGELVDWLKSPTAPPPAQLAIVRALLRDQAELGENPLLDWLLERSHSPALRSSLYRALRETHQPCFGQTRREKPLLAAVAQARLRMGRQAREDALNPAESLEVRAAALQLYATLSGPPAFADIAPLAGSPRCPYRLREGALMAAGASQHPQALQLLTGVAEDDSQPLSLRAAALSGLARLPGSLEIIQPLLTNPDPRVRGKAAAALSSLGDKGALQPLKQALAQELDEDVEWQLRNAVNSLEGKGCNNS